MIEKIWEILTTLIEQAQNSAMSKCKERGFSPRSVKQLAPLIEAVAKLKG